MKRGTPEHKKMKRLATLLSIPLPHAVGIMEMLWHFSARQAPEGDIGAHSDEDIARAAYWNKKPEILVGALVDAGWFERDTKYRIIIHDWPQHAEDAVKKWLARNQKNFLPVYGRCQDIVETKSRQSSDGVPPSREATALALAEARLGGGVGGTAPPPLTAPEFAEPDRQALAQEFVAWAIPRHWNARSNVATARDIAGRLLANSVQPEAVVESWRKHHDAWAAAVKADPKANRQALEWWLKDENCRVMPPTSEAAESEWDRIAAKAVANQRGAK